MPFNVYQHGSQDSQCHINKPSASPKGHLSAKQRLECLATSQYPCPNRFTVQYVSVAEKHRTYRTDMTMSIQRRIAKTHRHTALLNVNFDDYEQTQTTKFNHMIFLKALLGEAVHYRMHRGEERNTVSDQVSSKWKRIVGMMAGDPSEDAYCEALVEVSKWHLFKLSQ